MAVDFESGFDLRARGARAGVIALGVLTGPKVVLKTEDLRGDSTVGHLEKLSWYLCDSSGY